MYNKDLEKLEESLEKSNRGYGQVYETTKANLIEAKNNIAICTTKIDERSRLLIVN